MSYLTQTTMRALRAAPIAPRQSSIAVRPAALALARPFSSTQYRRASEVPKDPIADPEIQGFYEKLRNHQGAVDAMMKMAELMKEKGIDTTKPPSKMQMLKLSFDADMREAGQNLVEQMKAAGVEMNPEMLQGLYKKMQ